MTTMHIGFTGTQKGMTQEQADQVADFVGRISNKYDIIAHHGDCIGADAQFHRIVRLFGCGVHLHPPDIPDKRAFCDYDVSEEEIPYLDRNRDIVDCSQRMLATPDSMEEKQRSGTWSTIRYTKEALKSEFNDIERLAIVFPDGSVELKGRK